MHFSCHFFTVFIRKNIGNGMFLAKSLKVSHGKYQSAFIWKYVGD